MDENIAGVVLAGGRSSRMGQDKALLRFNGKPLLDHMMGLLLDVGVGSAYVSGDFEGHPCIPDSDLYNGPVAAIQGVLTTLKFCDGVLFVPVDMPLLTSGVLGKLLRCEQGAYYAEHPLPFYIPQNQDQEKPLSYTEKSVKGFLLENNVPSIVLPLEYEASMMNANTPEEWDEALRG